MAKQLLLQLLVLILQLCISYSSSMSSSTAVQTRDVKELEDAVQLTRQALENARIVSSSMSSSLYVARKKTIAASAWADCVKLYEDSGSRIAQLERGGNDYYREDLMAWLSGAAACHGTCIHGINEMNMSVTTRILGTLDKVKLASSQALALHARRITNYSDEGRKNLILDYQNFETAGLLASWDSSKNAADIVVAQDGTGSYKTIKEAVDALSGDGKRTIIYVKTGTYYENIEINRDKKNVMLVGDGTDKTVITGSRSVSEGFTTYSSSTFSVSSDGFWARDITFENSAGPGKHQAVAAMVASDKSVFYRCSFRGYQDTLFVQSQRQFYRDCSIYGTIDFIFGDAAVIIQNCDILVRQPMQHQENMITAQGRDDPNESTGISIHSSRVKPADDFATVKGSYRSYLGRPWKRYSRTIFLKTDLDTLVDPAGWAPWSGEFALDTLYYGEYMNTGEGANTDNRVKWSGFHVITDENEAEQFSAGNFIQGETWIPETGVPFQASL